MQHHGIPTRLLDWTETFAVALYFALKNAKDRDAAVWMLDPGELNLANLGRNGLPDPTELGGTYHEYFVDKSKSFPASVVALSPFRHNPRIAQQRAGFTLHKDLSVDLETLFPETLTKFTIPVSAQKGAEMFLRVAGISEFTLFPDLDGLARELVEQHIVRHGHAFGAE